MIEQSEGWCCELCGDMIIGLCNNDKGYVTHINSCMPECEICHKIKKDVRFEGSQEINICDSCLIEVKENVC
jgi:hypothetical protein